MSYLADSVFSQLDKWFENSVSESLLRIDTELFKYVMLPLYAGDSLIVIGEDGAL